MRGALGERHLGFAHGSGLLLCRVGAYHAWFDHLKKDEFNSGKHLTILLLLSPLLVAGVDKAEEPRRASPARVTISDSIRIAATADRVWEALGRFDSMDGAKPFLLRTGALPVPHRCTLEGEGEGSIRTCYFDKGTITQEVTAWQKPSRMEFKITGDTAHDHREPALAALVLGADRATGRPLRARLRTAIARPKTPLGQVGLTIHTDQP